MHSTPGSAVSRDDHMAQPCAADRALRAVGLAVGDSRMAAGSAGGARLGCEVRVGRPLTSRIASRRWPCRCRTQVCRAATTAPGAVTKEKSRSTQQAQHSAQDGTKDAYAGGKKGTRRARQQGEGEKARGDEHAGSDVRLPCTPPRHGVAFSCVAETRSSGLWMGRGVEGRASGWEGG